MFTEDDDSQMTVFLKTVIFVQNYIQCQENPLNMIKTTKKFLHAKTISQSNLLVH